MEGSQDTDRTLSVLAWHLSPVDSSGNPTGAPASTSFDMALLDQRKTS